MTPPVAWARPLPVGVHLLRRGAWYRVVNDNGPELLIVDVAKRNIPVPRERVQLRRDKPDRWSIVVRNATDPNATRGTTSDLGPVYAVCPGCAYRAPLSDDPAEMACPECHRTYPVEWSETC